jgi:hypothetical protein
MCDDHWCIVWHKEAGRICSVWQDREDGWEQAARNYGFWLIGMVQALLVGGGNQPDWDKEDWAIHYLTAHKVARQKWMKGIRKTQAGGK